MNIIAAPTETLPKLIDRATAALESARTSAEVLEAREMARVAYDAAKSAGRIAKAKQAHDTLIAEVHRAQAHALGIRARAEMRLAEEYDAAQPEEAKKGGRPKTVGDDNGFTAASVGLRRDEIHEARRLRDAEAADPGIIDRAVNEMVERGEEPTRAALKREVLSKPKPQRTMDPKALWLWGEVCRFERDGILRANPWAIFNEMTPPMQEDMRRLLPEIIAFLSQMEQGQ